MSDDIKDAKRFKWIIENCHVDFCSSTKSVEITRDGVLPKSPSNFIEAIDMAMEESE
jgi:hypothetical protein